MCINNPVQDIWIGESEIGLGWIWRVSFDTCFCVFFGTGVAGYCFGGGGGGGGFLGAGLRPMQF